MTALHRIQWIDSEIRAGRSPNARRLAERFEISHRQAQRDFEYLRDSLGAPLVYGAAERGYRYEGEPFVLPGQFVTPEQRGVLENLAEYYGRWTGHHGGMALDDVAALFARLSGRQEGFGRRAREAQAPEGGAVRTGQSAQEAWLARTAQAAKRAQTTEVSAPALGNASPLGLPYLATLSIAEPLPLPGMTGMGLPIPDGLAPYYRGADGPLRATFEFHEVDRFVSALLGSGIPFRVEHPRWLRERVVAQAALVQGVNAAEAPPESSGPSGPLTTEPEGQEPAAMTRGVVLPAVGLTRATPTEGSTR